MEIIFAGGSHYEINGFKSIQPYFDKVYVLANSEKSIQPLMRDDDVLINDFADVDCKFVFLCGYSQLITQEELEKKTYINIHGALLPKYRGMHPTFYAIMNGEKELGITFHIVDNYMDSGPILAQYKFEYTGQTVSEINKEIDDLVGIYAGEVISSYIYGEIEAIVQDEDEALFGAKRNLDDCYIDFNMSNLLLERFFRALTPSYPQPMIKLRGKRYEIVGDFEIINRNYYGPLGRAVNKNEKGVWIKVKEGFLVISKIRDYNTKEIYNAVDIIPIGCRF